MGNALLLVSENETDVAFATEVAATAGLTFTHETDPKNAANILAAEGAKVIFVDVSSQEKYEALENAVHETIGLFSDKINANLIHFISTEDLQKVKFPVQSPLFGNFIVRQYGDPKEAGKRYGRLVKATVKERAFGIGQYLAEGARLQVVKFKNTNQKQAGVEAVKNYLMAANFKSRMASSIANAVDEVLMNAMFDAPIDGTGRPIYSALSRSTAIPLEARHAVEMHVGFDNQIIGISVVDSFGSLDRGKLLSHVSKKYSEDEYRLKNIVAGAGIGLATIFSSGGSLVFTSESGLKTEVMIFFRRCDNFRIFKEQFRYLVAQFYF